jgi:hypothetical protein
MVPTIRATHWRTKLYSPIMVPTIRATPLKSPTRLLRWTASSSVVSVPSSLSPPGPATSDSDASASLAPAASPNVMVCPLPLAMPLPPPRKWTPPSLLPDTLFSETKTSVRFPVPAASPEQRQGTSRQSTVHTKTSISPWRRRALGLASTTTWLFRSRRGPPICYTMYGRNLNKFRRKLLRPSSRQEFLHCDIMVYYSLQNPGMLGGSCLQLGVKNLCIL